jgi:SAM-dependent methyltransferase
MVRKYSNNIWQVLSCPQCSSSLEKVPDGAACRNCQIVYPYAGSGSLDLRLKQPKIYPLEFELGSDLPANPQLKIKPLLENSSPEVDFSGMNVPRHLSKELMSHFPKAKGAGSLMLDLGCGSTIHQGVGEHAGFEYVGLDYDSAQTPILGDAHALPFEDNSFEFILSIAMLEHIRYPLVVMREAFRVMKPSGKLVGTVAFLEPFHGNSFYHHTHLGALNSLQYGGFKVSHLAPNRAWPMLIAQTSMGGLFPGMPQLLAMALVRPLRIFQASLLRLNTSLGRIDEEAYLRRTAGSLVFIAVKE